VVELLIAMAVILVIAALAVPNLFRAQKKAYEAGVISFLRTLQSEQEAYRLANSFYADNFGILGLNPAGAMPVTVLVKHNYVFTISRPTPTTWSCIAEPVRDRPDSKFFFLDDTLLMRVEIGNFAGTTSPQL
jgi:type II secretory pathway pseudopilin PulG